MWRARGHPESAAASVNGTMAVTAAAEKLRQAGPERHDAVCYHCGEPVPGGPALHAVIGGLPRVMCCAGFVAVAEAIAGNGLDDYYRSRDRFPESPRKAIPAVA